MLDVAAPLGIGAVAVALLRVAGPFDFSVGAVAATNVAPTELGRTPLDAGLIAEDVEIESLDGVHLRGELIECTAMEVRCRHHA